MDDGGGEGDLLPHANRERLNRTISLLARVAPVEHLVGAAERLGAGQAGEAGRVAHHLHGRQSWHRALVLGDHADELPHHAGVAGRIAAEDANLTCREPHQAEDRSHERALAGTVGSDESGDPVGDLAADAVEDGAVAVPFDNALEPHGHLCGRGHPWASQGIIACGVEPSRPPP